ncbi:hypothetical protein OROMI_013454 [Orobanche minor]
MMKSSLMFWNWKFMFVRGVDLEHMPVFREAEANMNFPVYDLRGEALDRIRLFCGGLGFQATRDNFMNHEILHDIDCLPSYKLEFKARMVVTSESVKYLASSLKKLKGVYKKPARPGPEGSTSVRIEIPDTEPEAFPVRTETDVEQTGPVLEKISYPPGENTSCKRIQKHYVSLKAPCGEALLEAVGYKDFLKIGQQSMRGVAKMIFVIPNEVDWIKMGETRLKGTLKECVAYWAKVLG